MAMAYEFKQTHEIKYTLINDLNFSRNYAYPCIIRVEILFHKNHDTLLEIIDICTNGVMYAVA